MYPITRLDSFFDVLDSPLDSFFDVFSLPVRSVTPTFEITESDSSYIATLDLPGYSKEDVSVSVRDGLLTVSAKKTVGKKYSKFERVISLGDYIDEDKVEAELKDGVLKITLPKTETSKSKSIKIN